MPPARTGAFYEYEVQGELALWLSMRGLSVDWSIVEGGASSQFSLDKARDLRIQIVLGHEPQPRLTMLGEFRQAHQATYYVQAKGHGWIDAGDEWIDAERGHLIQAVNRNQANIDGAAAHFARLNVLSRPALLFAPMLWNQTLSEGATGYAEFPARTLFYELLRQENLTGRVRYEVGRLAQKGDECRATVAFVFTETNATASLESGRFEAVFADGLSLPKSFQEEIEIDPIHTMAEMRLTRSRPGTGTPLPRHEMLPKFSPAGDRLPLENGFLVESSPAFATPYREAYRQLTNYEPLKAWLSQNPDAKPSWVEHYPGRPGSEIIDEWRITWTKPDGTSMGGYATKRRPPLPVLLEPTWVVWSGESDNKRDPPLDLASWTTLDELVRLHKAAYGTQPETLFCQLGRAQCYIGTYNDTRLGYADESGSSFTNGLGIWLRDGWIIQSSSLNRDFVDKPVPRAK